jgi:hypothetical protein
MAKRGEEGDELGVAAQVVVLLELHRKTPGATALLLFHL